MSKDRRGVEKKKKSPETPGGKDPQGEKDDVRGWWGGVGGGGGGGVGNAMTHPFSGARMNARTCLD